MKIGVDLDHTIIDYQKAFLKKAIEWNLAPNSFIGNKNCLKNWIQKNHSEQEWMRLQGYVYGKGIHEAELMPDVIDFFLYCHQQKISVVIISHKTQFGHFDLDKVDLREVAKNWLYQQHFFDQNYVGLSQNQLCFASTREEKLKMIEDHQCTLFIDDLLDVLLEPAFPKSVERIWYAAGEENISQYQNPFLTITGWNQMVMLLRARILCQR